VTALAIAQVVIVLGVVTATTAGLRTAARRAGAPIGRVTVTVAGGLTAWMAFTALLAGTGWLTPAEGRPPLVFVLVGIAVALALVGLRSRPGRLTLDALPPWWIMGLQIFRIPVELVLWRLHLAGFIPERMTFQGRNFDLAVGLTAPLVAWMTARGRLTPVGQVVWHLLSLTLVLNVAITAVLSTPGPLHLLQGEVPLTIVGRLPWVWLPTVLVPVAVVSHVVSLVRLCGTMTGR
jgi:hypothetical protein